MAQDHTDTSLGTATGATSGSVGSMGSERAASSHGGVTKASDTGSTHAPASRDALRAYGYTGDTGTQRAEASLPADDSTTTWADVKTHARETRHSGRTAALRDSLSTAQNQAREQIRLHPWLTLGATFAVALALAGLYRSRSRSRSHYHPDPHYRSDPPYQSNARYRSGSDYRSHAYNSTDPENLSPSQNHH